MRTNTGRTIFNRKTGAFLAVLFLLAGAVSYGFSEISKSAIKDSPSATLQEPAQKEPSRTAPDESDRKALPEKPKEPASPFSDFTPSERIDADKAVDFPVDI